MDIEEYIERIVDNGKIEDMQELSDMLEDTMEIIKDYDKHNDFYICYVCNKFGRITDDFDLLLKTDDLKQMKIIK